MERWTWIDGAEKRVYEIAVKVGKPFDVVGLKGASLREKRDYAARLRAAAARLYGKGAERVRISSCPCCEASADGASPAARIMGVVYLECPRCGHGYIADPPPAEVMQSLFRDSEDHAAAYTDRDLSDRRMAEIIEPKIDWLVETYRSIYDRPPETILDLGAGGGHFVAGAIRRGLKARGVEASRASRRFAREALGVELADGDALAYAPGEPVDAVTMWGLLEYVQEPLRCVEAASRSLAPGRGMLVVEVPRLHCLGTTAQGLNPETVTRHLDPTSHVNVFSDASLATLLVRAGLRPVAAWYFGMDAYELLVQQALRLDDDRLVPAFADAIAALQARLDEGRVCDDLVMAAVPE